MKDEIMKEVVGMTKEGIIKSIDVLQREVPELISQIFKWEFIVGVIGCIVGVGFIIGAWKLFRYAKKSWDEIYEKR